MMAVRKDMTGLRFGLLTALEDVGTNNRRQVVWRCRCDCGREHRVSGVLLRNGEAKSCGCRQYSGLSTKRHGETSGHKMTREYSI